MKIFKYLILPILILVGVYALLCAFGPKNLNTERSTTIEAPQKLIYNMVNDIKSWEDWSAWNKRDPEMKINYPGKLVGVGANSRWESELEGNGTQEIVESVADKSIKTKLIFDDWDGVSYANWKFTPDGENTNVSWNMEGDDLPFLMRGAIIFMGMKGRLNADYDTGLANIKKIAEDRYKNKVYDGYTINDINLPEKHYVLLRQEVERDDIQQFYASNLGGLFSKVQDAKVEMDGMPCGLFYNFNNSSGKIDMAAAIPTKEALIVPGTGNQSFPAKRALQVDYFGDYHNTEEAHEAIEQFMKDNGLFNDFPVVEEYVTDPTTVSDPDKWKTTVTYYLAG